MQRMTCHRFLTVTLEQGKMPRFPEFFLTDSPRKEGLMVPEAPFLSPPLEAEEREEEEAKLRLISEESICPSVFIFVAALYYPDPFWVILFMMIARS